MVGGQSKETCSAQSHAGCKGAGSLEEVSAKCGFVSMMIRCNREEAEADSALFINALRDNRTEASFDLAERLAMCAEARAGSKAVWTGDGDAVFKMAEAAKFRDAYCNHHACWHCRPKRVEQWAREKAQKWAHADNEHCSMMTLATGVTGDLGVVRQHLRHVQQALRNRRAAASRQWGTRWRSFIVDGHAELDPVFQDDVLGGVLGQDQQLVIDDLPLLAGGGDMRWVVRVHLVALHPGIAWQEVQKTFSLQWRRAGQVHVEPFDDAHHPLARHNAGVLLCYGAKHREQHVTGHVTDMWPMSWRVQYWSWMHSMGRALQPIRIQLGPMSDGRSLPQSPSLTCIEPMPCSF